MLLRSWSLLGWTRVFAFGFVGQVALAAEPGLYFPPAAQVSALVGWEQWRHHFSSFRFPLQTTNPVPAEPASRLFCRLLYAFGLVVPGKDG